MTKIENDYTWVIRDEPDAQRVEITHKNGDWEVRIIHDCGECTQEMVRCGGNSLLVALLMAMRCYMAIERGEI